MTENAAPSTPRWCVVGSADAADISQHKDHGYLAAVEIDAAGNRSAPHRFAARDFAAFVAEREAEAPRRWVWHDTAARYPALLDAGVRVERCYDLRLCHQILTASTYVTDETARSELHSANEWAVAADPGDTTRQLQDGPALFEIEITPRSRTAPDSLAAALDEFDRQRCALQGAQQAGRLALLLSAESAGALIAVELASAGVPWDETEHDRILTEQLGPRPSLGAKPERMVEIGQQVRMALADPRASLDSPPKLLGSLRAAGIEVSSTSRWELEEHEHPAIPLLLQYKKLARLFSANGWAWLDEWVQNGRYRPVYVPGGVVTGRWASSGGGALQLPRQLRLALRADPGWLLVSADVSQLEPRVLAAMAGDRAMAAAGRGKDLYAGIVESGAVATRQEAKIAVLGAMYGSTTGDAGRLVPRLRRTFPAAMRLVDEAATVGEQGGVVTTWLGRSSHPPGQEWVGLQEAASLPGATKRDEETARRVAREFGRFTRNFIVQGTAAEWALAWMAQLRLRLAAFPTANKQLPAKASGQVFEHSPHLAFFLHDEVIVHTPREHAAAVAEAIELAAVEAGKLLFGDAPVDFRLDLRTSERALKD